MSVLESHFSGSHTLLLKLLQRTCVFLEHSSINICPVSVCLCVSVSESHFTIKATIVGHTCSLNTLVSINYNLRCLCVCLSGSHTLVVVILYYQSYCRRHMCSLSTLVLINFQRQSVCLSGSHTLIVVTLHYQSYCRYVLLKHSSVN